MPAGEVVEGPEVLPDFAERRLAVLVFLPFDQLFLQFTEGGLGDGVVPALPLRLMLGSRRFSRHKRR